MAVDIPTSQTRRVYVGNVDYNVTEESLKEHMKSAGDVVSADLIRDHKGRSRGYAIVEFANEDDAKKAIETLNDTKVGDRAVFVREDREVEKGVVKRDQADAPRAPRVRNFGGRGRQNFGDQRRPMRPVRVGLRINPQDEGRLVYLGNLPWRVRIDAIKEHFRCGYVQIARDQSGRSKGYAIVTFDTTDAAKEAIKDFHDTEFDGRKVIVREFVFKKDGANGAAEGEEHAEEVENAENEQ